MYSSTRSYLCTTGNIHYRLRDMRGIKAGNFLMYRNSHVCVICKITSNGTDTPTCITGMDSSRQLHQGPASDWTPVMGKQDELLKFSDGILGCILQERESKR